MTNSQGSALQRLVSACCAPQECAELLSTVHVADTILAEDRNRVSRAVLTQALNLLLFRDLLIRVPTGRRYVQECASQGRRIQFDHGALRTVALSGMGNLPAGERAITRLLIPLGYRLGDVYPLTRLGMTGRSYTHMDFPEELPQFFVSELHPECFSPAFQESVTRVTATSREPLSDFAKQTLHELESDRTLHLIDACKLLPVLLRCFRRQHTTPQLSDYTCLLAESSEMAWIATEGNAFNHATDRVACLDTLVAEQQRLGRPLKQTIETSHSGRVRQTAFRADPVEREFVNSDGTIVHRRVPGSFYEFIQRDRIHDPDTGESRLDLAFDSGNAQGIFKMTAAA